jgi:hypothetical protein
LQHASETSKDITTASQVLPVGNMFVVSLRRLFTGEEKKKTLLTLGPIRPWRPHTLYPVLIIGFRSNVLSVSLQYG